MTWSFGYKRNLMNGERLLKLIIFFLIVIQALGVVFETSELYLYSSIAITVLIFLLYFLSTKRIKFFQVIVLLVLLIEEILIVFVTEESIRIQLNTHVIVYSLLFYFLYYNHKSFRYNSRDVFTLVLGSSLYTVIFIMAYVLLRGHMEQFSGLIFLNLLLLYVLLIVGGMHYINIRSEKSLWFFLSMLHFAFSDFMLVLDRFYLQSYELKVLMHICDPLAFVFLVNYMVTKSIKLKSEEFEGF